VFKNLNCELLGISGRQSEIIELALTYGFRGIDIDMADLVKRCQRGSFESAARFLLSSKLSVGGFECPIDLDADDEAYAAQAALLNGVAEVANRAQVSAAILSVPAETDRLPYPEYFEVIRKRITEICATFAKEGIKVALDFTPLKESDVKKEFTFVRDVEGFVALANSCNDAGIVFDSWKWFLGGGSKEQLEQIGVQRALIVRIGDAPEGSTPELANEDDCLLPGSTNLIDNVEYLKLFVAANAEVPVSPKGRAATPGGTRDAFIGKTQDALDLCFQEAGIPCTTRKPELAVAPPVATTT